MRVLSSCPVHFHGACQGRPPQGLTGYDAMHGGLGEAELSGNDAYAVTFSMQLSDFLAIDNHPWPAKCGRRRLINDGSKCAPYLHPTSNTAETNRLLS